MAVTLLAGPALGDAVRWEGWSPELFVRAKKENRLVLLDLEAVWCHWCHVMEKTTYADPRVQKLLNERYIAVRVDQDARPDLSNRYEDYGWPATILFAPDGRELAKLSGYIAPDDMVGRLETFAKDPTPGPSARPRPATKPADTATLPAELRKELGKFIEDNYDKKLGGWKIDHKLADWYLGEYLLEQARRGDKTGDRRVRDTLTGQQKLLDPVWGGLYQYSTDGDWKHPHFEKIMTFQAENLRVYALAAEKKESFRGTAVAIDRYLREFLTSPEGAFYTSQDADATPGEHAGDYFKLGDAARRKRGVPRVDTHRYARENGWVIRALATLHATTGDDTARDRAVRAAEWVVRERSLAGGGFRHDEKDAAGPYLGDTVAMGDAFLELYTVTADRSWLKRAEDAAAFVASRFAAEDAGFRTAVPVTGEMFPPGLQADENLTVARFTNRLFHHTGKKEHRDTAERAMRSLVVPAVASRFFISAGVLLAADELARAPVHVTVVGPKGDAGARALFRAALRLPTGYKRVDWWDRAEGPLPYATVTYPTLEKAAAFACSGSRCSRPAYQPEEVAVRVAQIGG